MKNSRVQPHRTLLGKYFSPSRINLRAVVVVALIALASSLPLYALAQGDDGVQVKKSRVYFMAPDRQAFVIHQGPNGEAVCRDATPEEVRTLISGENDQGLHRINHLQTEKGAASAAAPESANGLTINLRGTAQLEANQPAKAAFIAAAAKWEALIKDPITINIDVDFGTQHFGVDFNNPNVIGVTSSSLFSGPYTDIRARLISHASNAQELALYNALPATTVPTDIGATSSLLLPGPILQALNALPSVADPNETNAPKIGFNSAFNFDLDPSDGITGNRTDFDAVAVHEIGHALGFTSAVGRRELDSTEPIFVTMWDLFRFRPATANLNNFSTAQRVLSSGGTQVQFNGGGELGLSTGRPDGTGGDAFQAGHWKADDFGGAFIGIMDPTIARNTRETMTANDQSAIDAFGYTISATPAPANDNFANAEIVSGNSGSVNGTNAFATKETGEPIHSPDGVPSGKSVWYRWTAPNSGTATITTLGSNFDTVLAVYSGTSVGSLGTALAANDDAVPMSVFTSSVQFSAVNGTTYQIAVDGYDFDQGNVTLNWSLPGATPSPSPTPPVNTVQFTASTASVSEAFHATAQVDLQVTRTGNTSAAASVSYATSDATASDRSDYEAAAGTLQFAAGEAAKTITVFIVDDSIGENAEVFNVTLSGPVACTLGSPAAVAVTIDSNEAANGTNPVKDATFDSDFFVRQHYLDFFNRAPDAGGLAFWKNQIDSCTDQACREIRRINVSAAFFVSIEFQQTGYLVYKTYQASFDSHEFLKLNAFLPDTQEIGRGVVIGQPGADAQLEANKAKFFNDFVQRANFVAPGAYPTTLTAAQFVDKLNTNTYDPNTLGGGALTQSQRDALVTQLSPNPTSVTLRAQVLRAVAENSVFSNRQTNKAFVLMQYFGYMRRNPNDPPEANLDFGGYNFWLGKLNQFGGNFVNAEMVKAFITSSEYQLRFGP